MTVEESMRTHPAGKRIPPSFEVARAIAAFQDEEAVYAANRARVEVEESASGPITHAYGWVDEWHHEWSTGRWGRAAEVIIPTLGVIGLFLLIFGAAVLGEMAGGWPT